MKIKLPKSHASPWSFLIPCTALLCQVVRAQDLITVHSTNSWVHYTPETVCQGDTIGHCGKRYAPWSIKTYTSHDGQLHAFYQTDNWASKPDSDLARRWSYTFSGTAVYIYAPSKEHLGFRPGMQEVCLDAVCEILDIDGSYDNAPFPEKPLLIWSKEDLHPQSHVVEMRFLDGGPDRKRPGSHAWSAMSLEFLRYQPLPLIERRHELEPHEEAVEVDLYDTNFGVEFDPPIATSGCCRKYVPWDKVYTSTSLVRNTFHHTSNWGNTADGPQNRRITFQIERALSLSVWGAPKAELERHWGPYQHGRTEICLHDKCYGIDAFQAYLNVPKESEHLPVLLWSMDTLQPMKRYTVVLKLLDPTHPLKDHVTRMTLQRITYSELRIKSEHPIPSARYEQHEVEYRTTTHGPGTNYGFFANAWLPASLPSGESYMVANDTIGWYNAFPYWNWEAPEGTYEFKVFGAPKSVLAGEEHAAQQICIDSNCQYIDTEHIYMKISHEDSPQLVLLYHATNLDFKKKQSVRVQAVKKEDDSVLKVLTLARVEYETVTLPPPPPTPRPNPNEPPIGSLWAAMFALLCVVGLALAFPSTRQLALRIAAAIKEPTVVNKYLVVIEDANKRTRLIPEEGRTTPRYVSPPRSHHTRPRMTEPAAPPRNLTRSGGARSPPPL